MRNMNYLKVFFFTTVFAFTLNAATAQKTNKKTDKAVTEKRIDQPQSRSNIASGPKWAYSVAMVSDNGGKFDIKFMDGKSKAAQLLARQNQELGKKMEEAAEEIQTETDLINYLAGMKMELISVVSMPESGGRTMKYYLRTQIAE